MPEKKSKLAKNQTTPTEASVDNFINGVENEQKRNDCFKLIEMMQKASGEEPKMWGPAIVGFGYWIVKSPNTGREVEWLKLGFSPRKANLALYLPGGLKIQADSLEKLGKHKTGGGCLYINKLSDVDLGVLNEMFETSLKTSEGN